MSRIASLLFLNFATTAGVSACTCVSQSLETPKSMMRHAGVVFRGTLLDKSVLPPRPEMRVQRRYSFTFRVDRYWKGPPAQTVTLYGMQEGPGSCFNADYEVGKEYLVYASREGAKDYKFDDFFWFGWTDVIAPGTPMLQLMSCMPDGETSDPLVRETMQELGRGRSPRRQ